MKFKNFDELTDILPPLATDDYNRLKRSIKKNGIREAIRVLPDGTIVDGFHRKKIAKELKIKDIPHAKIDISRKSAIELGISLNLARRQLSHEQKQEIIRKLRQKGFTQEKVAELVGITQQRVGQIEDISNTNISNTYIPDLRRKIDNEEEKEIVKRAKEGETQEQIASNQQIGQPRVSQIIKKHKAREKKPEPIGKIVLPKEKHYKALTIDPPWPVKKIERDKRPNQGVELDYPIMSIEEIKTTIDIARWIDKNGCHIYLWTTHKFLPIAFEVFKEWEVKYECLLTWIKNVGFTPFSWMYSTEPILFGRIGNLPLLKKGERLDFKGKVREHSRKPDEFYNLVKKVSPGPRLDMFSREEHKGFDQFGSEVDKFDQSNV